MGEIVSRYGVYRDLKASPYEYQSPYGDLFKFRSKKKLEIYTRDIQKELERLDKTIHHFELDKELPPEIVQMLYRTVYRVFYRQVEG